MLRLRCAVQDYRSELRGSKRKERPSHRQQQRGGGSGGGGGSQRSEGGEAAGITDAKTRKAVQDYIASGRQDCSFPARDCMACCGMLLLCLWGLIGGEGDVKAAGQLISQRGFGLRPGLGPGLLVPGCCGDRMSAFVPKLSSEQGNSLQGLAWRHGRPTFHGAVA